MALRNELSGSGQPDATNRAHGAHGDHGSRSRRPDRTNRAAARTCPTTWPGERLELHCTALGKALAAFEPEEHWDRFVTKRALPRHNENTICSRKKFLEELATTRKRGYAFDDEEVDLGVRCLGVTVFGAAREPVAAISVSGTSVEVHADNAAELVKLLTAAGAQIHRALGGNGTAYGCAAPAAT